MVTTVRVLTILIGIGVAGLQVSVFLIARFYQKSSGEPTRYWLFLVSMVLMLAGDCLYIWQGPPMLLGHVVADLFYLVGGAVLMGNSYLLLRAMTQGN